MTATIEPLAYRRTFSELATGVTVLSAFSDLGPVGMTANSVVSVSLDPPLVGLFPAQSSRTWPRIRATGQFCVSVLSSDQAMVSRALARVSEDRFTGVDLADRPCGPGIAGALAWIDCEIESEQLAGDHFAVIGRVVSMSFADGANEPLVFFRGSYGTFC